MCKHCERLVKDIEHKEIVHKFMAIVAEKIKQPVDDIEIIFEVVKYVPAAQHILDNIWK